MQIFRNQWRWQNILRTHRSESPSSYIYFSGPLADLIGLPGTQSKPIWRLEPNVFHVREPAPIYLIFRSCSYEFLKAIRNEKPGEIVFFIDDNIWEIGEESYLPADYRKRLLKYKSDIFQPLCELADIIISPSAKILEHYTEKSSIQIEPALIGDVSTLEHFDTANEPIELVFCGTRSHLVDLDMIAPDLRRLLDDFPNLRLTTFLGRHVPRLLQHPQSTRLQPMTWTAYRQFQRENNFHISVSPAIDTAFNQSRSISRMMDNAYFGAAGLFTDQNPFSQVIDHGRNGLLVDSSNGNWYEAVSQLIDNPKELVGLAYNGQITARKIGDRSVRRRFLLNFLGLS